MHNPFTRWITFATVTLMTIAATVAITSAAVAAGAAGDWPQLLGPTRNGVYAGNNLADAWPTAGPKVLWSTKLGQGFAGPAVAQGKVVIFHRVDDNDVVDCRDARTGNPLWQFTYPTDYRDDFGFDEGPRAVPTIADGLVYTYGAEGMLHCLDMATGKKIWSVDTRAVYQSNKGFFGRACSPLVEGDLVMLNLGGRDGAGLAAFNRKTGELAWKATNDDASYASPVAATIHERRYGLFYTRAGLVALNPADGHVYFQMPWRPAMNASVNAAAPVVAGDLVFLSTSYNKGAIVIRIDPTLADGFKPIWSGDDILSNHYATSVYHDGYLYGFDGRQEYGPSLHCVDIKTGKVMWRTPRMPAGTVMLAQGRLLVLGERGELIMAPATPQGFNPTARAQVLGIGGRAYAALADGLFYARDKRQLVCVDLRAR